eukprot:1296354-Pyramimonas_sp.AAC.1
MPASGGNGVPPEAHQLDDHGRDGPPNMPGTFSRLDGLQLFVNHGPSTSDAVSNARLGEPRVQPLL